VSPPLSQAPLLVIVPCGRSEIWSKHPKVGPTPAADAYTEAPFTVGRQYTEASGRVRVPLPGRHQPRPYEITFRAPSTGPIAVESEPWGGDTRSREEHLSVPLAPQAVECFWMDL
jgi:hypothetical protein